MTGRLVILSGPPGAGKTTVAHALAEGAGAPAVHLRLDDFLDFVVCGRIAPWLPQAQAQNAAVMDALAAAARVFAGDGFLAVVDGVIGPWFLDPFRRLDREVDYVVLRPALEVALARAKGRGEAGLAASGPIAALHAQFADLGELERHALDCGAMTPEATLARVREGLAAGAFRLDRT